jgi:hypothetical protein
LAHVTNHDGLPLSDLDAIVSLASVLSAFPRCPLRATMAPAASPQACRSRTT